MRHDVPDGEQEIGVGEAPAQSVDPQPPNRRQYPEANGTAKDSLRESFAAMRLPNRRLTGGLVLNITWPNTSASHR